MNRLIFFVVAASAAVCCTALGLPSVAAAPTEAEAYVGAVLDGLVEEGLLTQEAADAIRRKAKAAAEAAAEEAPPPKKEWYDKVKIGGYLQARWNDFPDKAGSIGDPENEFEVRRARLKLEAKPTDRLAAKLELDLPVGDGMVAVKDVYADLYLDDAREWWVRGGQAKMPFGFETPQSSSQRLPFERSDARRYMVPGERDVGAWLYYTPRKLHERFDELKSHYLGTGDFGLLALGLYQGQGINTGEANDDKHFVLRMDYPFELGSGRLGQAGFSIFTGEYVSGNRKVTVDPPGPPPPITATVPPASVGEHAWNVHFYLPPDPWGVQAEYLDGKTVGVLQPNRFDPSTWSVGKTDVDGWYTQLHYSPCDSGTLFARYDEMNGFRKRGLGSLPTLNDMERWTFGYAHDIDSQTELTIEYDDVKRNGMDDDFFGVQWQYAY